MELAIRKLPVTKTAKKLAQLLHQMNYAYDGNVHPSQYWLSKKLNCSRRTIIRCTKQLEKVEFLKIIKPKSQMARYYKHHNTYKVILKSLVEKCHLLKSGLSLRDLKRINNEKKMAYINKSGTSEKGRWVTNKKGERIFYFYDYNEWVKNRKPGSRIWRVWLTKAREERQRKKKLRAQEGKVRICDSKPEIQRGHSRTYTEQQEQECLKFDQIIGKIFKEISERMPQKTFAAARKEKDTNGRWTRDIYGKIVWRD